MAAQTDCPQVTDVRKTLGLWMFHDSVAPMLRPRPYLNDESASKEYMHFPANYP